MFPVLDVNGNPIAFGARATGHEQPKYLNSPETPAYIKGQHLYGLFQSKEEIRKKKFAILVEGYLDLIALYQFGITNTAAAVSVPAFTPEQAKLLSRFTKKVVINYDGDSAGIKAARRAIEHLLPQDFEIKVLVLPDEKDPDDFVRENGEEAYNEARGKAFPYLQFVLDSSVRDRNIAIPKQKAEAIEEVLPVLSSIRNAIQKRESFDQTLNFFRIDEAGLKRELWNTVKGWLGRASSLKQQVARATRVKITVAEQHLLELLVHDLDLQDIVLPLLEESDYEALGTSSIFQALYILNEKREEPSLARLLELAADDEAAADYIPLLLMSEPKRAAGEAVDQVLHDAENCVFTLRSMAISNRIFTVTQDLMAAEQAGDMIALRELVAEKLDLGKIELELRQKIKEI
jgi:DNA primase